MSVSTPTSYALEAAMEQWTDMRVMHVDDLYDLLLFHHYIQKEFSQNGLDYWGHQFRRKEGMWLLTVKVSQGKTPLVVFLSSATTTGCIRLFVRQLEEERLRWVRDRYAWF